MIQRSIFTCLFIHVLFLMVASIKTSYFVEIGECICNMPPFVSRKDFNCVLELNTFFKP
jgi:hypothetical protein